MESIQSYFLLNISLNYINKMLLLKKIEIYDIPYEIRISSNSFYVTACRIYRNDIVKYNDVLKMLNKDIMLSVGFEKKRLSKLFKDLQYNVIFLEDINEKFVKEDFI